MERTTVRSFIDILTNLVESGMFSFMSATILTIFTWLFGAWDIPLKILLTVIIVDYISAMINAYITKSISSRKGFEGMLKKTSILIVLILAVLVDRLLSVDGNVTRTAVAFFFISNESLSILENLNCLGVPFPEQFTEVLIQLNKGNKKEILTEEIHDLEIEIEGKEEEIVEIQREEGEI